MFDIAIIGAGVIGAAIARELSRYQLSVVVLEKENDVACGTTKANSAIVHAGYDASVHSVKGKMNVRGNALFEKTCRDLDVRFQRIGSLVVAFDDEERTTLNDLYTNGILLGVPDLKILTSEEVFEKEPHLSRDIVGALFAPSAGITEPWELAIAYMENAVDNGVMLKLEFSVTEIFRKTDYFELHSPNDCVEAKIIINCAGVYADVMHDLVSPRSTFKIHPRRGQYYLLDKTTQDFVKHVVFPCPSKLGKGVLIVPTVDGNTLVGPDSEDLDILDKEATMTCTERLNFVSEQARRLAPNVPIHERITAFSGLRAEPTGGDFIIGWSETTPFFYNVAGMKSPGLSSAPAIAEFVLNDMLKIFEGVKENIAFNPIRRPWVKLSQLSDEEQQKLIEKDPRFGHMICRCEMITEGEIVDAIHRSVGGRTVNGIKRRVRPGAGRCQGGFCGPRVMEILARELHVPMIEVLQEGVGSKILLSETGKGEQSHDAF